MEKEGIPESYLDKKEAEIAAMAEKPVRDLAREEGVDLETKDVFDARAEARGEEALANFHEREEKLKELVNPETKRIEDEMWEIRKRADEEFGHNGQYAPKLYSYKLDEKGKMTYLAINGLIGENKDGFYPIGPLGKRLDKEATAYIVHARKSGEGRGDLGDPYLVAAYNNDPVSKELIDKLIGYHQAENKLHERLEEIKEEKREDYNEAANINAFLEKIGSSERVPADLNINDLIRELAQAKKEANTAKIDEISAKLFWSMKAFDKMDLTLEKNVDIEIDLSVIYEKLKRLVSDIIYAYDSEYPKESRERFRQQLRELSWGKNL